MNKSKLLEPSSVVVPVFRQGGKAIGSIDKARTRKNKRMKRKAEFILESEEKLGKPFQKELSEDNEAFVRDLAKRVSSGNILEKRELLNHWSLDIDERDGSALARQNTELINYPMKDMFSKQEKVLEKLENMFATLPEVHVTDGKDLDPTRVKLCNFMIVLVSLLRISDGKLAISLTTGALFGSVRLWNEIAAISRVSEVV